MSELIEVRIKLPREILDYVEPRSLERELRLLAALELYREGRVSLGKAAEIAGLSIREFLYELRSRNIPLNYDVEELEEDMKTVTVILGEAEGG